MDVKELFWSIVNCPWSGSCDACKQVLSEQDGLSCRQVPEPWSGNLETASYMGLGANPAIDINEVFPSRTQDGKLWMNVLPGLEHWTEDAVYSFFTRRFNDAECPGEQKKYVVHDDRGIKILKIDDHGRCNHQPAQNTYWAAYAKYCKVINGTFDPVSEAPALGRDIVVSDVVHCKGPRGIGVNRAWPVCKKYTYNILRRFVNNVSMRHTLLIIGADYSRVLIFLESIWKKSGGEDVVGSYDYKRIAVTHREIMRQKYHDSETGKEILVYYGIPAPSGANGACQNIILHDVAVSDKTNVKHQEPKKESASGFELKELKPKRKAKLRQKYHDLLAE